jgi:hypothetical protein
MQSKKNVLRLVVVVIGARVDETLEDDVVMLCYVVKSILYQTLRHWLIPINKQLDILKFVVDVPQLDFVR